MITNKKIALIVFAAALTLVSCKHEPPIDPDGTISQNCDPDTVYFGNTILPLLVSNCAMSGCHDQASHREDIILTDYYSIINSDVLKAGHPNSSDLVDVLTASGERRMPPNPYQTLTTDQINSIRKWIEQGAKFNTCIGCDTLNFKFAADIWPILNTNCNGCHNNSNPGGNIYIRDYADVQAMVLDGSLMGSLQGNGYSLMPKNTNGLQPCKITQIQKWINDGAQNN